MRILFTGGFTLGSVTPLLAVAEELKRIRELEISESDIKRKKANSLIRQFASSLQLYWVGTRNGPERRLVKDAGIKYSWIWAPKWRRYFDVRNLFVPLVLHLATKIAWFKLLRVRPDVIITAGGYVGVPIVWAAWWLRMFGIRIPSVLHNQDVRWSLANKLVAPFVARITYALPGTVPKRWKHKAVWTGNPVREFILSRSRHSERNEVKRRIPFIKSRDPSPLAQDDRPVILIIGGGTGAKRLNEIVVEALPELTKQYQIIHLTGKGKDQLPITNYQLSNYRQFDFVTHEIADLYAAADLVITRAGMGTLTELAALGKPMIIVPLPGTHQEDNARYFEKKRAAVVIEQGHLTTKALVQKVAKIFQELGATQEMRERACELGRPDAAKRVAEEIIALAKK